MHRIIRTGFVAFAVLALIAPLAFAEDAVAVGKKGTVEFTGETRVGSTVLKPGHYQLQHRLIDGQHYLVVRAQSTARVPGGSHYAGATGDEVARVPCRVVSTDKKQAATALHLSKNADGSQTLTQIKIRGEKGGHVVELEPQS